MDPGGNITEAALGDKRAIEDSGYKVLGVFDWKDKEVEAGAYEH